MQKIIKFNEIKKFQSKFNIKKGKKNIGDKIKEINMLILK